MRSRGITSISMLHSGPGITSPWYDYRVNPRNCAALCLTPASLWSISVQVYDSSDLHFFLDGAQATSAADSGDMVIRPNELVIGKAGPGLGTSDQPINECNSTAIFARAADSDRVGLTCNCCCG